MSYVVQRDKIQSKLFRGTFTGYAIYHGGTMKLSAIQVKQAKTKEKDYKFAKTRPVNFIPLPDDIVANVIEWRNYLMNVKKFKDNDPLFPIIDNRFNQENMLDQCLTNQAIKSDTTMRNVFKRAFECACLKYINPHSFRKTLARYAQKQSPEFLNAVRQNLGHSSIDTTLSSYGQLSMMDQRRIITDNKGQFV